VFIDVKELNVCLDFWVLSEVARLIFKEQYKRFTWINESPKEDNTNKLPLDRKREKLFKVIRKPKEEEKKLDSTGRRQHNEPPCSLGFFRFWSFYIRIACNWLTHKILKLLALKDHKLYEKVAHTFDTFPHFSSFRVSQLAPRKQLDFLVATRVHSVFGESIIVWTTARRRVDKRAFRVTYAQTFCPPFPLPLSQPEFNYSDWLHGNWVILPPPPVFPPTHKR
jgi:hypothetical protein